jgi:hypothetical protein
MASKTRKLTNIRERKASKLGAQRKNEVRRKGTTAPRLPLDKPNADEKAQAAGRAKTKGK